jgi:polysaccharide export outer membrane protein
MAAGKTVGKLQEELQALYVPDYYKSLSVVITTEERFVYVGGEVKNPGPHQYLPGMTVLKAIQSAGDFTEYGNRRNVTLTRASGRQETVNCSKAINDPKYDKLVYPDDRIHVKKRVVW